MKKNSLTTAIIAGVAGVAGLAGLAHAVNLNPDGLGQVLVYPYYTVNGGNSTVVTVVNTTDRVKAVKVRFLEALNSAEVLDFNLYLSPYDVWAANITAAGDDAAKLVLNDTSCTVPALENGEQVFLTNEFAGHSPDALADLGLPRTRQGHIEVIEMGVVADTRLAGAATHSNGKPKDCSALSAAWEGGGLWDGNVHAGMEPPSGGLFGGATIVSAEYGRTLSYNADAIDGFFANQGAATLHYHPGSVLPSLENAATGVGIATARIFSNGELYEIDYSKGIDAVSAVFQSRYIYNEFNLNPNLAAASEWVITFPTKRHYVYNKSPALLPFTETFPRVATPGFRGSCHEYDIKYWDREERTTSQRLVVSPPPLVAGFSLCWESNVLAFGQNLTGDKPTRILGTTPTFGANGLSGFQFEEGWARLEFDRRAGGFQYWLPSAGTVNVGGTNYQQALIGQPVVGFWASEVVNTNVGAGVLANFGVIHKHRVSRDCRLHTAGATSGDVSSAAQTCPSK